LILYNIYFKINHRRINFIKFSEQIKKIRLENNLKQEDMANKLHISRQTISSWETDRNLPDLEMIVNISKFYNISLDELILGKETNIKEKLIKDGSEGRKAKINLILIIIATFLLLFGFGCLLIKSMSVEYVDSAGLLHENFFLIPIGYLFIFCSLITYSTVGIKNIICKK
jgi:transcriptional regulator with XRE-family HTH domain